MRLKKPGPDNRTEREIANDLLTEISASLSKVEEGKTTPYREEVSLPPAPTSRHQRLTFEEEKLLATQARLGNVRARNLMVQYNVGLCYMVASTYRRKAARVGVTFDDMVQEGCLGLVRALETYEVKRGLRFSTYATQWVRAKIGRIVLREERHASPRLHGLSSSLDENGERRDAVTRSLETSVDDDDRRLGEILAQDAFRSPDDLASEHEILEIARKATVESNDPRQLVVLHSRILNEEKLEDVGKVIGVTREGARLIQGRIFQRLKETLGEVRSA